MKKNKLAAIKFFKDQGFIKTHENRYAMKCKRTSIEQASIFLNETNIRIQINKPNKKVEICPYSMFEEK